MPLREREPSSFHPSYLALDRAALRSSSSEVTAHLAGCEECRRYVAALGEVPSLEPLRAIRATIARDPRRFRLASHPRWVAGGSAILAAACALLLVGRAKPPVVVDAPTSYVGAKGFASVWIYVKRGSTTNLWDGKQAIAGGDRLRIKVDPGGYRHVDVYSLKNADAPERLYAGAVSPTQSVTLPDAWEIDSEPGAERLMVVFSISPVTPNWNRWSKGQVEPGVVVLPFVLPKASVAKPDASTGP